MMQSGNDMRRVLLSPLLLLMGCASNPDGQPLTEPTPAARGHTRPATTDPSIRNPDLVELRHIDPTFKIDLRYATTANVLGRPLYKNSRALLQRPVAEALARVNVRLKAKGYGLAVLDAYRPWSATKELWQALPTEKKAYFADPAKGSIHNNGCAVDLTLYELSTGKLVEMPSGYDEFGPSSKIDYSGGPSATRMRRDLLRAAMEAEGFSSCQTEWWHYNHKDWQHYKMLDCKL